MERNVLANSMYTCYKRIKFSIFQCIFRLYTYVPNTHQNVTLYNNGRVPFGLCRDHALILQCNTNRRIIGIRYNYGYVTEKISIWVFRDSDPRSELIWLHIVNENRN